MSNTMSKKLREFADQLIANTREEEPSWEVVKEVYQEAADSMRLAATALEARDTEDACKTCGQIDSGQTGEYCCKECGLPTVHDDPLPTAGEVER